MSWFSRFPSSTFSRRRHFPLGVALVVAISTSLPSLYALSRGDVNDDERVDIADATYLLTHLFLNGPEPKCVPVADMNSDTVVDLSDSIFLLVHLFGGGPAPASLSSSEQSSCGVIAPQPSARGLFFS
ncbi:MAG TPA: dockerin type I repeat-containing protein, partial [Planctomycetota bacterium]|nr:dockerin type I repeat-containing protein [Planctomycetota bacterium]